MTGPFDTVCARLGDQNEFTSENRRFLENAYTGLVQTLHGIDIDSTSAVDFVKNQIKQRRNAKIYAASGIASHERYTESRKKYA